MNKNNLNDMLPFIKKQHVLSLCCTNGNDIWCANCFYVFDETEIAFYIMTSEESRHANLLSGMNQKIAGTINGQPKNISLIKGLQYSGTMKKIVKEEEQRALNLYTKRFPIAKIKSLPLWKIEISEMKFTNNVLGFGKKSIWMRE